MGNCRTGTQAPPPWGRWKGKTGYKAIYLTKPLLGRVQLFATLNKRCLVPMSFCSMLMCLYAQL